MPNKHIIALLTLVLGSWFLTGFSPPVTPSFLHDESLSPALLLPILLLGLVLAVSSVSGAGASSRAGLSSVSVIDCHQNEHLGSSCLDPPLGVSNLHSFPEGIILYPRGGYNQR